MHMTRSEAQEDMEPMAPSFPWGLRLHLDETELDKLGISLPNVGEEFVVVGIGTVTSVSQNQSEDGTRKHVEVQLEKLAFESRNETINLDS
jgi:hypothetical protein